MSYQTVMATGRGARGVEEKDCREALLCSDDGRNEEERRQLGSGCCSVWRRRVREESKKLWVIVGPAIFTTAATYSITVTAQALAGHLGDLELASVSIGWIVLVGFNYGLMLGMASAVETLCGQSFGAKKHHMLGVYLQRSWVVLLGCAVLLLPIYIFAEDVLLLTGQSPELSAMAGRVAMWLIPMHLSYPFLFPLRRFLQCQSKNFVNAAAVAASLVIHAFTTWLFVFRLQLGLFGITLTVNISWWATTAMMFAYVTCGGCPETWHGFSVEAFAGLWEFVKLAAASGVMLCLENWYYRILIFLTGNLKNATIAVDALSICMTINGCEMAIPLAFLAGTGQKRLEIEDSAADAFEFLFKLMFLDQFEQELKCILSRISNSSWNMVRVANELGAGNWKGARFATVVSSATSLVIGLFFWALIMCLHGKIALIFSTSAVVLDAVDRLTVLLAFTILLNSIQPVLSGVAVGSGWQSTVAYVNIGCYYVIGIPTGILLGWLFDLGVLGIWAGMIGGTAVQTLILAVITVRCDWEKEAMIASTRMEKLSQVQ